MTASHTTRVKSDNSVFQSTTQETDPRTHLVVQLAFQRNEATSSTGTDSRVGQLSEETTESQTWRQDSLNECLIDEGTSSRTQQSRRTKTPMTVAI